jgi:hypothetical protein
MTIPRRNTRTKGTARYRRFFKELVSGLHPRHE